MLLKKNLSTLDEALQFMQCAVINQRLILGLKTPEIERVFEDDEIENKRLEAAVKTSTDRFEIESKTLYIPRIDKLKISAVVDTATRVSVIN